MKEIKAIIRPFKLDEIISELHKINGLPGLTISEVKGFGRTKAKGAADSFMDGLYSYVKKIKIEMVVSDSIVEKVVNKIRETAYTGNPGDGKIFILDVSDTIRVSTNESGDKAI